MPPPVGPKKDAAYINQLVADLRSAPALPPEASEQIHASIRHTINEGFVTEKMLRQTWEKFTGGPADGAAFKRFRAEVFLNLLAEEGYMLEESKVRGDAADALRLLASTDGAIESPKIFEKLLGGPVVDVDVSDLNKRVYLRTAEATPQDYYPGSRGVAVIRKEEGVWKMVLSDDFSLPLSSAPKAYDPDVLTPAERKEQAELASDAAKARVAVRDLLTQLMSLPEPTGLPVRLLAPREDLQPGHHALVKDILDAMNGVDGQSTTLGKPKPLSVDPLEGKDLTEDALKVIASFRDGELNFLRGPLQTDLDRRTEAKQDAQEHIDQLVGFVTGGGHKRWGLEMLARAENDATRADYLVNGFGGAPAHDLSEEHIARRTLTAAKTPEPVKRWMKENARDEEVLISMAGPNRRISALRPKGAEEVKVDGKVAGYVVRYDQRWQGQATPFAAVFDAKGNLMDPRVVVRE